MLLFPCYQYFTQTHRSGDSETRVMLFLCAFSSAWKNIIHCVTQKISVSLKTECLLVVEIFAAIHPEEYVSRSIKYLYN